jgi:hypothetical protein
VSDLDIVQVCVEPALCRTEGSFLDVLDVIPLESQEALGKL